MENCRNLNLINTHHLILVLSLDCLHTGSAGVASLVQSCSVVHNGSVSPGGIAVFGSSHQTDLKNLSGIVHGTD